MSAPYEVMMPLHYCKTRNQNGIKHRRVLFRNCKTKIQASFWNILPLLENSLNDNVPVLHMN